MCVIKVDGQVLYSPAFSDAEYQVIAPRLKYELNKAGSLSFTLPPEHVMRDAITKMKSIITVEHNDVEIFRGRVLEDTTDLYNQTEVYCEGELSFLLDSLQRPYDFDGKAADFFRMMIEKHNEQVEEDKRFVVGAISAVTDENKFKIESTDYTDTFSEIRSLLLNDYGGFLRIRYENDVRYLDYLKEYNENSDQNIEFGVNLLDIESHINAQDIFTVLVPLSDIEDDDETVTIASVNNGLDYLESAEGIAKYGRITKYYVWPNITDPARLLELGQEKLKEASTVDTLTINAIDLHLLNADTDNISLGDTVHIVSAPNGIDRKMVCSAINVDMQNPEETEYTFGEPVQVLTASVGSNTKRGNKNSASIKRTEKTFNVYLEHMEETDNRLSTVEFDMDAIKAEIKLKASVTSVTDLETRVTSAEIAIDGANAAISLKADKTVTDALGTRMSTAEANIDAANAAINLLANTADLSALEKRVSSAEVAIDGMEAQIALKASLETVNEQEERLSTAEANIDAANAQIALKVNKDGVIGAINVTPEEARIKAAKIVLDGYVTTSKLSSEIASINTSISTKVTTSSISAANAAFTNIEFGGAALRLRTGSFVTAVTLPNVSGKYIWYMDDTMDVVQQYVLTGFTQGEVTTASLPYVGT